LGVELSASQKLSVLNIAALKYLGFDFNYTYAHSTSNFGTEQDDLPLRRSPEHTRNLSFSYDNPSGLFAVLAGTYRDYVFDKFESDTNIWLSSTFHLDATVGYAISDRLRAKVQINNITNQANEEIELRPDREFSRVHEREAYNIWATFGLELNLR